MNDLRTAAQQLLGALDKSLYMNDYCGLEVSKHDQPDVTDAIEALRAALAEPEPPPEAQTEAEKMAYCAGWWDALAKARKAEPVQEPVQEVKGCDHCNHPLYAATKCRVCGRVTEEVQALRSAWDAAAAAERNAILQMSREQWFKTQADFEEAIRARGST